MCCKLGQFVRQIRVSILRAGACYRYQTPGSTPKVSTQLTEVTSGTNLPLHCGPPRLVFHLLRFGSLREKVSASTHKLHQRYVGDNEQIPSKGAAGSYPSAFQS